MFDIEIYIDNFISLLTQNFGSRLLYVGLQGSYLRNEADEKSDIDIMVILDLLTVKDLGLYRDIVKETGSGERACGFICGKSELMNWNPVEICQLIHTTKGYYGRLAEFVPAHSAEDEINFIKISLNNMYHELCHRYIHSSRENNIEKLPNTYKSVFFILQNIHFRQTGNFIQTKQDLLCRLHKEDKEVLQKALEIKNQSTYDFDEAFQILFEWCKNSINRA